MEHGAGAQVRIHPDFSAVPLHDALADCEADAGARNFFPMQPFENAEDAAVVLRGDPMPLSRTEKSRP